MDLHKPDASRVQGKSYWKTYRIRSHSGKVTETVLLLWQIWTKMSEKTQYYQQQKDGDEWCSNNTTQESSPHHPQPREHTNRWYFPTGTLNSDNPFRSLSFWWRLTKQSLTDMGRYTGRGTQMVSTAGHGTKNKNTTTQMQGPTHCNMLQQRIGKGAQITKSSQTTKCIGKNHHRYHTNKSATKAIRGYQWGDHPGQTHGRTAM